MKKIKYLTLFIIVLITACSHPNATSWFKTQNGYKFYASNIDTTYVYLWDGSTFNNLVNGEGIMSVYSKSRRHISSNKYKAYYGALNSDGIKKTRSGDRYIGNMTDGKLNGFGCYVKTNGESFIGHFKNGNPSGYLKWYKNKEIHYEGYWEGMQYHGKGTLYDNGEVSLEGVWDHGEFISGSCSVETSYGRYTGELDNSKPNGYGVMKFSKDEGFYDGEWLNGVYHGNGSLIISQDTIIGGWNNGTLEGDVYISNSKCIYEGSMLNGCAEGFGIVVFPESVYNGTWIGGIRSGIGDYLSPNGDMYSGEWEDDLFCGEGRLTYSSGGMYNGEWLDGLQNGVGEYRNGDFTYSGDWEHGWMQGEAVVTFENGDRYKGKLFENELSGYGTYWFANNNAYKGEFVGNKFNGIGQFEFASGALYEGEFHDGNIQGQGTLNMPTEDGVISITGIWSGEGTFPSEASIMFEDGDTYEGELINGFPTGNGIWTAQIEREQRENHNTEGKDWLTKSNELFKKHEKTWDKCVVGTLACLNVVSITCTIASVSCPALIPITASILAFSETATYAIVATDLAAKSASTLVSIRDTDDEEQIANLKKDWVKGQALNAALLVIPGISKWASKTPVSKIGVNALASTTKILKPVSSGINKTVRSINTVLPSSFTKGNKVFGGVIKIVRDKSNRLALSINKSRPGKVLNRTLMKLDDQIVSSKRYNQFVKNSNDKLNLNVSHGDGTVLYNNMYQSMTTSSRRKVALDRLLYGRRPDAHHIVAGNSASATGSRKILDKYNINVNDPRNGILLSRTTRTNYRGSWHGRHTNSYDDYVYERLSNSKNQQQAIEILDDIKRELYQGKLQLLSDASHGVNKIFN